MNDQRAVTVSTQVGLPGLRAPDRALLIMHPDEQAELTAARGELRWSNYDGAYYLVSPDEAAELYERAEQMSRDPQLLQEFLECDAGAFFALWAVPPVDGMAQVLVSTGTSGGSEGMLDPTYDDRQRPEVQTGQGHLDPAAVSEPALVAALAAVRGTGVGMSHRRQWPSSLR